MAKAKVEAIRDSIISSKISKSPNDSIWFTTGSALIDEVAGAGRGMGFESSSLVNICGMSGSGKTFLAVETLANAVHRFGDKLKYRFVDSEGGALFDTEGMYGFSVDPNSAPQIKTVEDWHADAMQFVDNLKEDEIGLHITDSWDGLVGSEVLDRAEERQNAFERDKEFKEGSFLGGKNKFASSEGFPTLVSKIQNKKVLFIITSQVRDNVGAGLYAPKYKVTGGAALLFYCNTRLWIKPVEKIEVSDRQIGVTVECEAKKSRGNRPFRKCLTTLYFTYGIDNVGSGVDYLYDLRTDLGKLSAKADKPMKWDETEVQNREELINFIEDSDLESELYQRVHDKWEVLEKKILGPISGRKKRFSDGK